MERKRKLEVEIVAVCVLFFLLLSSSTVFSLSDEGCCSLSLFFLSLFLFCFDFACLFLKVVVCCRGFKCFHFWNFYWSFCVFFFF